MNKTELLKELKRRLKQIFPDLNQIILFGSQLKNKEIRRGTDIDILLVFDRDVDWKFEAKVIDTVYEIELENDVIIDIKVFSKHLFNTSLYQEMPFIREVLTTGVEI